MRFDIFTLFPEMFAGPFDESIIKRAREAGLVEINIWNIRDFTEDRHRTVDDAPYGGGGGMVLKVEPICAAVEYVMGRRLLDKGQKMRNQGSEQDDVSIILLSPQGDCLNQRIVRELVCLQQLLLVCGHYEGVDERVRSHIVDREISIGDYVLTGGELAAMVVVDAVVRLIPGVISAESPENDSFSTGLLEGPQYTRPSSFRGVDVPDVLLSGNHAAITDWRKKQALLRTMARRPDLLAEGDLEDV